MDPKLKTELQDLADAVRTLDEAEDKNDDELRAEICIRSRPPTQSILISVEECTGGIEDEEMPQIPTLYADAVDVLAEGNSEDVYYRNVLERKGLVLKALVRAESDNAAFRSMAEAASKS